MEPPSNANGDQTRDQAQSWNGPEAGHWLVQEHRYQRMAVNPYRHMVDTVPVARTGTLDAGQLAAGLAAVVAAVALTQLAAARGFAGLVHRD
jgi:hypothetical protein